MIIYLLIFITLFVLEVTYLKFARKLNIIDKPNERSSHQHITLRGGGIVFYFGALCYFFIGGFEYPWFIAGLTIIGIISFIDDWHPLSSNLRLLFQFCAVALIIYQWGIYILPWWQLLIILFVCSGTLNAFNFMDGINGITGGYSLITLVSLLLINNYHINFVENNFLWVVIISVIIFLYFNFRNKAVCFAGDVGAICIAYIILFFLGKLIIITQDLSYAILLLIYGVDSVLTIIHRLFLHENITEPHRKHLFQILANELKIPHLLVSSLYVVIQVLVTMGYFCLFNYRDYYFMIILVLFCFIYIACIKKFFYLCK